MQTTEQIVKFYQEMYGKHGANAKGMGYVNEDSHYRRLALVPNLVELGIGRGAFGRSTWLDVGCGVGLLMDHLWLEPLHSFTGIDALVEYVAEARRRAKTKYHAKEITFHCGDFLQMDLAEPPLGHRTYGVVSAIGTVAWQPATTALDILQRMWKMAEHAIVFTVLINRPFPLMQIMNFEKSFVGCKGSIVARGYAPTNEAMVALLKG